MGKQDPEWQDAHLTQVEILAGHCAGGAGAVGSAPGQHTAPVSVQLPLPGFSFFRCLKFLFFFCQVPLAQKGMEMMRMPAASMSSLVSQMAPPCSGEDLPGTMI